jgi:uncharacterized membrane protein affecting hemolysin expression
MRNPTVEWPWSAVLPALAVIAVLVAILWGVAWWADAVDFMQANTNAGVGE